MSASVAAEQAQRPRQDVAHAVARVERGVRVLEDDLHGAAVVAVHALGEAMRRVAEAERRR